MKLKSIIFLIALFLAMADLYAGSNDDTVWTKNIWPENVTGVMFSRDCTSPGDSKVFVSTNAQVRIYDTQTGDSIGVVTGVGDFKAYSPDGKFIYTKGLKKLDAITFDVLATYDSLPIKTAGIYDVALTGDGQFIIAVLSTSITEQLPLKNIAIYSTNDMKFIKAISFTEFTNAIESSLDGKYFVVKSGLDDANHHYYETLTLWDAKTFQQIKILYRDSINANFTFKFTPDSKYLAVGLKQVLFYETVNFTISKKTEGTLSMAFTNDSKYMITGDGNVNTSRRYNIDNGNLIYQYQGWGALTIDISRDQNYIIIGVGPGIALFNSMIVDIPENTKKRNEILIYPNPINDIANISFNNNVIGTYKVEIFNNTGISFSQLFNGFLDIGKHNFNWNTYNFPNGIYFCRITGAGTKLTYKIIVNK